MPTPAKKNARADKYAKQSSSGVLGKRVSGGISMTKQEKKFFELMNKGKISPTSSEESKKLTKKEKQELALEKTKM